MSLLGIALLGAFGAFLGGERDRLLGALCGIGAGFAVSAIVRPSDAERKAAAIAKDPLPIRPAPGSTVA